MSRAGKLQVSYMYAYIYLFSVFAIPVMELGRGQIYCYHLQISSDILKDALIDEVDNMIKEIFITSSFKIATTCFLPFRV